MFQRKQHFMSSSSINAIVPFVQQYLGHTATYKSTARVFMAR